MDDGGRGLLGGIQRESGGGVSDEGVCLGVWLLGQLDRGHHQEDHGDDQTGREGVVARRGQGRAPAGKGEEEGGKEEREGTHPGCEVVGGALGGNGLGVELHHHGHTGAQYTEKAGGPGNIYLGGGGGQR